jgi:hypothetical protein
MADMIKCPSCGEGNLPNQEFCQFCRTRLQPLTNATKGADAPIKPGQLPTKKNTAELEPILPQWLRDARDSARKSAEDDAIQAAKQIQASPPSSAPDLLAGLHSQTDNDEDETPDWLASITGDTPKSKKAQAESPEVRWVELGDAKDFAKDEPNADSKTPDWLAGLNPADSKADEKNELTDWFQAASNADASQQPAKPGPFDTDLPGDGASDWLKQMAADNTQDDGSLFDVSSGPFTAAPSNDTPDWLRQMADDGGDRNNNDAPFNNQTAAKPNFDPLASDTPSWLQETPPQNEVKNNIASSNVDPSSIDAPDWLRAMGGADEEKAQSPAPADFSGSVFGDADPFAGSASDENVPDWLKGLPSAEKDRSLQGPVPTWLKDESSTPSTEAEVPSWLSSKSAQPEPAAPESEPFSMAMDDELSLGGDIPSWLQAAAPQSSVYDTPPSELPNSQDAISSEASNWLNAFKSVDIPPSTPAFSMDEPMGEGAPPAFTPGASDKNNGEALFTDMPDWLSSASDSSAHRGSLAGSDAIAPGELPSWVQAMRPVDSGTSRPSLSTDQTLESRGALAGLQGVLPSVPGFAPTSKPKIYSIKLQASDEQQSHALLLEQILAAETEPVPIASFSVLRTSRSLRWGLSAVFLTILTVVLFSGIQIFALPSDLPNEIANAKQVAQSIPEGAAVLVAFDYQPARVGEMQAAAAPIFNLMRKPSLTVVSTNETGALLAERFASGPFAGINSDSGISYLNLGYLPGGQMGIREFAQNPSAAMPQLTGFSSFSQFAAFIILTDDPDDARIWIEQTSSTRGALPIVVISSAQAAPMIEPYFESQQILGLVSGLYGSAVLESNNAGGPGAARTYWDAFSLGMLLSMVFILLGGLVNLALGLRDRAAAREEK